jgi:cbb3-type cytochrome oxidase subunit 3
MKLVDVMSASGLSMYAIVALLLFVIAFLAIVVRTYAPGTRAQHDLDARLPFSDDEPGPARRARE